MKRQENKGRKDSRRRLRELKEEKSESKMEYGRVKVAIVFTNTIDKIHTILFLLFVVVVFMLLLLIFSFSVSLIVRI